MFDIGLKTRKNDCRGRMPGEGRQVVGKERTPRKCGLDEPKQATELETSGAETGRKLSCGVPGLLCHHRVAGVGKLQGDRSNPSWSRERGKKTERTKEVQREKGPSRIKRPQTLGKPAYRSDRGRKGERQAKPRRGLRYCRQGDAYSDNTHLEVKRAKRT